jgi:hypothetical protein
MIKSFTDMRLGLFVHYLFFDAVRALAGEPIGRKVDGTVVGSLDELANGLDVEGLADAARTMRAEYVIFTAWHANMNAMFPSAAMERWRGGHCSRRDVVAELAEALRLRGIGLMLYVHPSDGHDFSKDEQDHLGWNAAPPYERWNEFINDVFDEMVKRYRGRVLGYWVDGGMPPQFEPGADRLRETIRRADPQAVVVQNEAFTPDRFRRWADLGCREWIREPLHCETLSTAAMITQSWLASHTVAVLTPEVALRYTVVQAAVAGIEGGGAAWSAGPYPGGRWEAGVDDFFVRLGRYVDAIAPALFGTKPSESFVTEAGPAPFWQAEWVATKSADGATTWLHVLRPPVKRDVALPSPKDGKVFSKARLLSNGRPVEVRQDASGVRLTLGAEDGWDRLDTVIEMT